MLLPAHYSPSGWSYREVQLNINVKLWLLSMFGALDADRAVASPLDHKTIRYGGRAPQCLPMDHMSVIPIAFESGVPAATGRGRAQKRYPSMALCWITAES